MTDPSLHGLWLWRNCLLYFLRHDWHVRFLVFTSPFHFTFCAQHVEKEPEIFYSSTVVFSELAQKRFTSLPAPIICSIDFTSPLHFLCFHISKKSLEYCIEDDTCIEWAPSNTLNSFWPKIFSCFILYCKTCLVFNQILSIVQWYFKVWQGPKQSIHLAW